MPKKTKKQKLKAAQKRETMKTAKKKALGEKEKLVKKQKRPGKNTIRYSYKTTTLPKKKTDLALKTKTLASNYAYVKQDLIKITIFSTLAIALQIVLYFLLNRG